jgi:6-pyruvoyltetrahydropterin/6-carboxytetrahydropterin synthase
MVRGGGSFFAVGTRLWRAACVGAEPDFEGSSMAETFMTASRRFTFAAAVRLARRRLSDEENRRLYGPAARARLASGGNYQATLVFGGPVDPATGMMVNLAEVKRRMLALLARRWDHRFLNLECPPFDELPPTLENAAARLLEEAGPLFADLTSHPVACHLQESRHAGAIAYAEGGVEREVGMELCAARRTCSPHLSEGENRALFGAATALHGHTYLLRVVLAGPLDGATGVIAPHGEVEAALAAAREELDHTYLNELEALRGGPITSEILARLLFRRLAASLPVARVRLWELPGFSVEYAGGEEAGLVVEACFRAAHRLHATALSDEENVALYGKCNNPSGHGHLYGVEAAQWGRLDERTGACGDLAATTAALERALEPWRWVHLDAETADFRGRPSSGENIVATLWPRLAAALPGRLERLRLRETENNRFTVRRRAAP